MIEGLASFVALVGSEPMGRTQLHARRAQVAPPYEHYADSVLATCSILFNHAEASEINTTLKNVHSIRPLLTRTDGTCLVTSS